MRILILTDPSGHTSNNSVYGLANALNKHSAVKSIFVVSKAFTKNSSFFSGKMKSQVYGIQINDIFNFPADELFKKSITINLSNIDFIFIRLPRPIHPDFFAALIKKFPENKIINRPGGIIKTGNKAFLLNLNKFVPPVKLCSQLSDITEFKSQFPIVLKPLEEYGGKGIIRIDDDRVWINGMECNYHQFSKWYIDNSQAYLGMKFLKNVAQGDKRIIVVDGEILSSALRLPAKGNWLCNVSQGASSQITTTDQRENEIVEYLSPILKEQGIFYYGLDTLVDDDGYRIISEINTLSIGGIVPSENFSGIPLTKIFANKFVNYATAI